MKHFHGSRRQQVTNGVESFDPQDPHIVDFVRFAAGFLDAVQQSLRAEEIFLRSLFGQGEEIGAITAAKIDLQRRGAPEDFRQIERREVRFRDQSDHGNRIAPAAG